MSDPGIGAELSEGAGPGQLARRIFAMAWPNILYAVLDQGMGLVDIWLVGHVGTDAIAAVGLARRVLILIAVISMAISSGAAPIIGQAFGAGDHARVRHSASQALRAMFLSGLVLGPLVYAIARPSLILLKSNAAVLGHGTVYLQVMGLGLVCLFLNFTMLSLFRAVGQVRTPLLLMLCMNVLNVVLSYLLIVGHEPTGIPALGVAGAAWGTVGSRAAGAIAAWLIWQKRMGAHPMTEKTKWLDAAVLKQILRVGLPMGAMSVVRMGATLVFFALFASIPGPALAATTLAVQTRMMLIMPALMIQIALQTLVSHSLGAGRTEEAKRFTMQMQLWGGLLMGTVTVVLMVLATPAMRALCSFGQEADPELLRMGTAMLRISLCGSFFATAAIIFGGALAGGGDTKPLFIFTVISEWVIMLPLAFAIRDLTQLAPEHIYWAAMCSSGTILVMYVIRYRQGKWVRRL